MISSLSGVSQDFLSLSWSDHTPLHQAALNPSAIADQRPKVDIALIGVGLHGSNNAVYGADKALIRWRTLDAYELNLDHETSWAQHSGFIMGPSASFTLQRHAVGIHSSVRSAFSMHRVPSNMTDFYTTNEWDTTKTELEIASNARMKALAWAQFGASYAFLLHHFDKDLVTAGLSIHHLRGIGAAALYLADATIVQRGNNIEGTGSGAYAFAVPSMNAGNGWSTSVGITYKKMDADVTGYVPHSVKSKCMTEPYRYKIGFSVVDLGYILMKNQALYKQVSGDSITSFMQQMEGFEAEDPSSIPSDRNRFAVNLPTAMVLTYDHRITKGVYFNSTWIQRLTTKAMMGPERANVLAIGGRVSLGHVGVLVPVSLINYKKPLLGLGLRLGPLSIGSDNVLPIFFRSDVYAADIHMALHMRFWKGKGCRLTEYKGLKGFIMSIFKNPNKGYLEDLPGW